MSRAPRALRALRRRLGPLACVVVGEGDLETPHDGPLVVLCHGFGAPGDDLVSLARVLEVPAGTRFVFPAAPIELPMAYGDARAWWMVDFERFERAAERGAMAELLEHEPEGLTQARAALTACLDACASELGARPERTVLGGFSQGAMLSCDLALRGDRPLAGLVLLSGTFMAAAAWRPGMTRRRALPMFQSHGAHDPILPSPISEALRDELRAAGIDVTWVGFAGGHEIPMPVLAGLQSFLGRVLG